MNKLTSIRIKQSDGTYSEDIPVQVLAENVLWRSGQPESLLDIIGQVDVDTDGSLQHQIDLLDSKKINIADLNSYLANQISTDVTSWLNTNVDPVGSAVAVDASLSIEGAAADAKQTGNIKRSTINYNVYDFLYDNIAYISRTSSNVVFSWDTNNGICIADGTPNSVSFTNLYTSNNSLLPGLVPGGTYLFTAISSDNNLRLETLIYDESSNVLLDFTIINTPKAMTIPINAYKMTVRVRAYGTLTNATIKNIAILNTETNYMISATRAKIFANRSNMIADMSLQIGQYALTMGYYAEGDGGGALYRIASTRPADYHPMLQSGLYAVLIPNGEINAAALGAIGDNDTVTKARYAIQAAIDYGLNLRFPVDIVIRGGITIPDDLDGKRIAFDGDITYRGSVAALTVHNTKNVEVVGKNIVCTSTGTGILYLQDGTGGNAQTLYNTNVHFYLIKTDGAGIKLQAHTWGILECCVHVDKISSTGTGIFAQCLGEDNTNHSSFIGQMRYEIQHINCGGDNYALRFYATAELSTITGVFIDSISFENSVNGIMLRGDCKLIKIYNIRILEVDSFTWIINATGQLRYIDFSFTSPVRDDKIFIETVQPISAYPVKISGGIYSPTSYRFADYLIISSYGRTYGGDVGFERINGEDFVFKDSNANYRCFTRLINNSNKTIVYSSEIRSYFHPFGYNTLYITQNKTDGSIIKIMYNDTTAIFDGSTVTEEGETTYMIKAFYNPSEGSVKYLTIKL